MFNLIRFFAGFNIFNGEKLGKLIFYAILIAIGLGIYHKTFIAPTQKTNIIRPQNVIIQQYKNKDLFLGIKIWKIKLGVGIE